MIGIPSTPRVLGACIPIASSTALAALSIDGMTLGTQVYNTTLAAPFTLTVSGASLVTDQVVAVAGYSGLRWLLNSTNAVPGLIQPKNGAALTNADATINPASDAASAYTLPAATLTGAHVLTLGVTGSLVTDTVVQIIRRDLTANTYTVKDDADSTLLTFAASPATAQGASFYFNGTHFVFLSFYYVD